MGLVLGSDLDVVTQLRWAVSIAAARSLDLLVFRPVDSSTAATVEEPLDDPDRSGLSAVTRQVLGFVADEPGVHAGPRDDTSEAEDAPSPESGVAVRLKEIRCDTLGALRQELLAEVRKNKLVLVTMAHDELNTNDPDLLRERRLFLRYAPCEVVLCYGLTKGFEITRVMVASGGGAHAAAALRLGSDLALAADSDLHVVRVNPKIGPDAERVGLRRIEGQVVKVLGSGRDGVQRRVVVDDEIARGLKQAWEEGEHDLMVLGASRHGILGGRPARGAAGKVYKGKTRPVVVIVRAEAPIRSRFISIAEGAVERLVPQIDRDNRISLVDRVQSSSNWDFDFFALMLLSTVIAGIGLIQNSAAVVIGAMLVAPLMTPLLGMGLALVQGNPILAKISLRAVLLGLAVSLLVGFLTGVLTPGFGEPTREMLGRGGPGILDLVVAFASGLAAAYASSRPGLLAALPGVAIAAALVPPIATAGLALSLGELNLAVGALVLFTVNMVAIVLATVVTFWVVGLRRVGTTSRWVQSSLGAVMVVVLALGVYLSLRPDNVPREQRIPATLRLAMQERLGDDYRLSSIAVAYDELGAQLNIRIVGDELAPEALAHDIRRLARNHFNTPVRVRLVTEVRAGVDPP
jgi:uncharacterized hydrophobic protein (TIGR00271 family)